MMTGMMAHRHTGIIMTAMTGNIDRQPLGCRFVIGCGYLHYPCRVHRIFPLFVPSFHPTASGKKFSLFLNSFLKK